MHAILVFNAGSSSLKYAVFESRSKKNLKEVYRGHIDNHGAQIKDFSKLVQNAVHDARLHTKLPITKVGHRVVHGGTRFTKPTLLTTRVLASIKALFELAPLHNPANYAVIVAAQKALPKAIHTAIFDTGFHATMPTYASTYPLPKKLNDEGIRRYGFHGINHAYVVGVARKKLGVRKSDKVVSCHLGNGCSITAVQNGKSIDTSMGFTPLEGIPMGTRSGDIDAGIVFHLAHKGMKLDEIESMLLKQSGLKGLSDFSGDVRDLRAAMTSKNTSVEAKKRARGARLALEVFAYRIAKYVGAYATIMGGLDCLIFTGGTGEKAWYLRRMVMRYLKPFSRAHILVVPANEELKIAESCR